MSLLEPAFWWTDMDAIFLSRNSHTFFHEFELQFQYSISPNAWGEETTLWAFFFEKENRVLSLLMSSSKKKEVTSFLILKSLNWLSSPCSSGCCENPQDSVATGCSCCEDPQYSVAAGARTTG
ncbi:hypothetical protein NDU88_008931 [Pleurodeles waltl]|uniref:Uncharacterized protein n=1 Tax=Pleurodeles waltl TaxID=8319 RepID=A0AAV7RUL2_PLEWA|nr:hypothetical protein NDU88_008931 [Pleurodeles waltl]